jgi:hypothetical protein
MEHTDRNVKGQTALSRSGSLTKIVVCTVHSYRMYMPDFCRFLESSGSSLLRTVKIQYILYPILS